MHRHRFLPLVWLFMFCVTASGANAQEPSTPLLSLTNNKISTQNKFEFSAFLYDFTFRNLYTTSLFTAHAGVGYHFFDWLALEAYGGYVFVQGNTTTGEALRTSVAPSSDLVVYGFWRPKWFAGANLQWAPIYAHLDLLSEVGADFQVYALLGTTINGYEKSVAPNTKGTSDTRWSIDPGVGLRLFFNDFVTARVEYRESISNNPLVVGDTRSFTSVSWCQFGVSFLL